MSDPSEQDPPRNPPAARRPRGPRALARQAAREAARAEREKAAAAAAAAAPTAPPEAPPKTGAPAQKPVEEPQEEKLPPRGMVCPRCGKYHDITDRRVGSSFECKCGTKLRVLPPPEQTSTLSAVAIIRLRELRTRRAYALLGMVLAYPLCIVLISAALYLIMTEERFVAGTCAGVFAVAFLCAAVIATSEYRRTSAEIAGEAAE